MIPCSMGTIPGDSTGFLLEAALALIDSIDFWRDNSQHSPGKVCFFFIRIWIFLNKSNTFINWHMEIHVCLSGVYKQKFWFRFRLVGVDFKEISVWTKRQGTLFPQISPTIYQVSSLNSPWRFSSQDGPYTIVITWSGWYPSWWRYVSVKGVLSKRMSVTSHAERC